GHGLLSRSSHACRLARGADHRRSLSRTPPDRLARWLGVAADRLRDRARRHSLRTHDRRPSRSSRRPSMDPPGHGRGAGRGVRDPFRTPQRVTDIAIRGGTVVTPEGERRADIAVDGERISAIGEVGPASREIDAKGKLLLPGCVDLHTHLASTPTFAPLDDFEHGTRAAIAGGVTTVVSMVYQEEGSLRRGIERGTRDAQRSLADFAFHVVVTDPSEAARAEIPGLMRDGHAGLKVFMVSPRFVERRDDYALLLRAAADAGALVAVHARDPAHG